MDFRAGLVETPDPFLLRVGEPPRIGLQLGEHDAVADQRQVGIARRRLRGAVRVEVRPAEHLRDPDHLGLELALRHVVGHGPSLFRSLCDRSRGP
jgi:hypothetical protein